VRLAYVFVEGLYEKEGRAMRPFVLVTEDDPIQCEVAAHILIAAGYSVLMAADATEAIALLEKNPTIAVLFTDIIMPGMDGFALADLALRRWPGLRVLFATTRTNLRDVDDRPGLLPGFILLKPFGRRELITALDKTVARSPSTAGVRQTLVPKKAA
jgi:CheY-like chemotaxis protein